MKLSTDLIYEFLSDSYHVTKYGRDIRKMSLDPPTFWSGAQSYKTGSTYICAGASVEIPPWAEESLFVVTDTDALDLQASKCSILVLAEHPPVYEVFNKIQNLFIKYENWTNELQTILEKSSDIRKMTELTAILLDECIGLCSRDLEMVLYHNPHPENQIDFVHLTAEGIKTFWASHVQNTSQRVPFVFQRDGNVYCLNVYKNEEYLGVLVLPEIYHKLTEGRIQLFNVFFQYLYKAIDKLELASDSGLLNLKMVFRNLIRGEALDEQILNKMLYRYGQNHGRWLCMASQLSEPMKKLPPEFICQKIEASNANIIAVEHKGYIAMLLPVRNEKDSRDLPETFTDVVRNLLGNAGASIVFNNLTSAGIYYQQAVAAQKTALLRGKKDTILYFQDHAFDYILDSSLGTFTPKYLLPKELLALRKKEKVPGEVDSWDMLKCYLDNEMSMSVTARKLYVHRTTLQHRIDKICEVLDLSVPENRLYIHYCMYLYDSYEAMLTQRP